MNSVITNFVNPRAHQIRGRAVIVMALAAFAAAPAQLWSQAQPTVLSSRSELIAAAEQAELAANTGSNAVRTKNKLIAAGIRQRLLNGDFQIGDRIVLTYLSNVRHADTLIVRSGPVIQLFAEASLPLSGVLRSELSELVEKEVRKYVRAMEIEVTPLTRVGVMGEVVRPGYFALRSDVPLADAIMMAGGPTATADVERSMVRRGTVELRSSDETQQAISRGLTLDQFGLRAGDELIIGRRRDFLTGSMMPLVGALASIAAIFVAVSR
jgi:hypothetical protein